MLSPVNQIGSSVPQIPLGVLRHRPADWLRAETEPATSTTADGLGRVPLAFLRQLAADDQLRTELVFDPVATLARHGIYVAAEQVPVAVSLPRTAELERVLCIHATEEDRSSIVRWMGYLGGGSLIDDLVGSGDD